MRTNPIEINGLFQEYMNTLRKSASEREQLFIVQDFLVRVNSEFKRYDTYIIQLLNFLPTIQHPLLFTGMDPQYLSGVIERITAAVSEIPELKRSDSIGNKISFLKAGLNDLCHWVGIKGDPGLNNNRHSLIKADAGKESRGFDREKYGEVIIPAVEQLGSGGSYSGRLRKLRVEMQGISRLESHQLKKLFTVTGTDTKTTGDVTSEAAGRFLNESTGSAKKWSANATFEQGHVWHSGNSANAALAALFYCEMLKAENKREYFRLNPAVAITGDITEEGLVKNVSSETFRYKVEAAFFSWAQILLVPVGQLEQAQNILDELNYTYPDRELILKSISDIREVFYDRRLSLHYALSLPEFAFKHIWKNRVPGSLFILIIVLLTVIGFQVYGPIDKNPAAVEYNGSELIVKNSTGSKIGTIEVGEYEVHGVRSTNTSLRYKYVTILDIDGDGQNEIAWASSERKLKGYNDLVIGNYKGDTLNVFTYESKLEYESHPYIVSNTHRIYQIGSDDIDNDGKDELCIITTDVQYFPSYFMIVDPVDNEIVYKYLHQGFIESFELMDINNDKQKEIFLAGVNNSWRNGFFAVLSFSEGMIGQGLSTPLYKAENFEAVDEGIYVLLPNVLPNNYAYGMTDYNNWASRLTYDNINELFLLDVQEDKEEHPAFLQYAFNSDLELEYIGSFDEFDLLAKNLYEQGVLNSEMNGKNLQSYKDSLRWWDGDKFVTGRGPVFNKYSDFKIN